MVQATSHLDQLGLHLDLGWNTLRTRAAQSAERVDAKGKEALVSEHGRVTLVARNPLDLARDAGDLVQCRGGEGLGAEDAKGIEGRHFAGLHRWNDLVQAPAEDAVVI